MSLDEELLKVIDDIYDASIDPSRWQGAVAGINGLIGSRSGVLHVTRGLEHITEITAGIDPVCEAMLTTKSSLRLSRYSCWWPGVRANTHAIFNAR